jgi:threonine dehydratase
VSLTVVQYLRLILTSRVYEVVTETPLTSAINLSNRLECNVMLKREDLQPVFSFKLRGAYNKMAHLDPRDRWRGVVACSAGAPPCPSCSDFDMETEVDRRHR